MGISLSIKDVPESLADALRKRAARNHRSLQRELMAIVEAAAADRDLHAASPRAAYQVAVTTSKTPPPAAPAPAMGDTSTVDDGLLEALDAVVAGSTWGSAGLLTRELAHDRRVLREFDFDARRAEAGGPSA